MRIIPGKYNPTRKWYLYRSDSSGMLPNSTKKLNKLFPVMVINDCAEARQHIVHEETYSGITKADDCFKCNLDAEPVLPCELTVIMYSNSKGRAVEAKYVYNLLEDGSIEPVTTTTSSKVYNPVDNSTKGAIVYNSDKRTIDILYSSPMLTTSIELNYTVEAIDFDDKVQSVDYIDYFGPAPIDNTKPDITWQIMQRDDNKNHDRLIIRNSTNNRRSGFYIYRIVEHTDGTYSEPSDEYRTKPTFFDDYECALLIFENGDWRETGITIQDKVTLGDLISKPRTSTSIPFYNLELMGISSEKISINTSMKKHGRAVIVFPNIYNYSYAESPVCSLKDMVVVRRPVGEKNTALWMMSETSISALGRNAIAVNISYISISRYCLLDNGEPDLKSCVVIKRIIDRRGQYYKKEMFQLFDMNVCDSDKNTIIMTRNSPVGHLAINDVGLDENKKYFYRFEFIDRNEVKCTIDSEVI